MRQIIVDAVINELYRFESYRGHKLSKRLRQAENVVRVLLGCTTV